MTTLSPPSAAFAGTARADRRLGCDLRLRLLPSDDGWSLVTPDGRLVFHALGVSGRRRCLEAARDRGVVALV